MATSEVEVRVGIHDASRLEWSVSVPLPDRRALKYTIDLELDIPSNAFARHAPWDQLQSFTRLDGPTEALRAGEKVTIDGLRRGVIGVANRLARAHDGFSRHCRLAASMVREAQVDDLEESLTIWIEGAVGIAAEGRRRLVVPSEGDAAELLRERQLVDEYISVRLLELLAGVERALGGLVAAAPEGNEGIPRAVASVEAKVAHALGNELAYRAEKHFLHTDPKSPGALERYLDRASLLKKHFQEVLFLEPETFQVAERIHHWAAAFVAVIASTWAFAWQIALINRQPTATTQISSGIVLLAVIAGLVYAAKDRMKELGRVWIAGNVHRFYAQRVARYRAPARRLPTRDVIVSARESFDQVLTAHPDPLNPVAGATRQANLLHYEHKGTVSPSPALTDSGVRRIKHVFRYDLSPLFTRLDDAVKQVPVLDKDRVRFIDAPRCYRMDIKLRVTCDGEVTTDHATLVLHKRGLDRIERDSERIDQKETGIEPDHQSAE